MSSLFPAENKPDYDALAAELIASLRTGITVDLTTYTEKGLNNLNLFLGGIRNDQRRQIRVAAQKGFSDISDFTLTIAKVEQAQELIRLEIQRRVALP